MLQILLGITKLGVGLARGFIDPYSLRETSPSAIECETDDTGLVVSKEDGRPVIIDGEADLIRALLPPAIREAIESGSPLPRFQEPERQEAEEVQRRFVWESAQAERQPVMAGHD